MYNKHKNMNKLADNIMPIICVVVAVLMVFQGLGYWGWFLLIALVTYE